jgi:hypothetical protein
MKPRVEYASLSRIHLSSVPTSRCIFERGNNRKRHGDLRREQRVRLIHVSRVVLPYSEALSQPRNHEIPI